MVELLPNPLVEINNARLNAERLAQKAISHSLKSTKEDIKKIVVSWFDKEVKRGHFDLDKLIDSLYDLISR